jgi:hypothetical protein
MASKQASVPTLYSLRATFISHDGTRKTTKLVGDNLDLATGLEKKGALMQAESCVAAYLEPKKGRN